MSNLIEYIIFIVRVGIREETYCQKLNILRVMDTNFPTYLK